MLELPLLILMVAIAAAVILAQLAGSPLDLLIVYRNRLTLCSREDRKSLDKIRDMEEAPADIDELNVWIAKMRRPWHVRLRSELVGEALLDNWQRLRYGKLCTCGCLLNLRYRAKCNKRLCKGCAGEQMPNTVLRFSKRS